MKTLEEIKDEYAKEVGFENWEQLLKKLNLAVYAQHDNDIVTRRFSIEVAKQTQINCAESAKLKLRDDWMELHEFDCSECIDKKSILNESNIPEL